MNPQASVYATMVTNLDSTMQQSEWDAIRQRIDNEHAVQSVEKIETYDRSQMWLKNDNERRCERMINEHIEFATHFAGIVRTAYLYCPRILLTDAELFDGVFFLALGPAAVNGILGKSYKDGPSIIISGRAPTMQQALESFTLSKTCNVKGHSPHVATTQLTIRPLQYSAIDTTITDDMAVNYPESFRNDLTERINQAHRSGEPTAPIIAEAFAKALSLNCLHGAPEMMVKNEDRFRFLGQRWQEWIDAERQGYVLYEYQSPENPRYRLGFNFHFARNAQQYRQVLEHSYNLHAYTCDDSQRISGNQQSTAESIFAQTLASISTISKRSAAFGLIDDAALPFDMHSDGLMQDDHSWRRWFHNIIHRFDSDHRPLPRYLTRNMLKDWYQFIYQRSLADHLGAELISVTAPGNSFVRIIGQEKNQPSLTLDGSITQQLAGMPFTRFTLFCYDSRTAIENWRKCTINTPSRKKKTDTKNIAYAVEQATQERSLANDARHMFWGAILAATLALLSTLFDNVWLTGNAPIWLIVFVTWVIAIIPNISDVLTWLKGVHSASKTVISLSNTSSVNE